MKLKRLGAAACAFALSSAATLALGQTPATPRQSGDPASMSTWMNDYSTAHQGRVSRKAYMDEMSRRWDRADAKNHGMTPEEINKAYGTDSTMGSSARSTPGAGTMPSDTAAPVPGSTKGN